MDVDRLLYVSSLYYLVHFCNCMKQSSANVRLESTIVCVLINWGTVCYVLAMHPFIHDSWFIHDYSM